jgi:hypothetical protein
MMGGLWRIWVVWGLDNVFGDGAAGGGQKAEAARKATTEILRVAQNDASWEGGV